MLKYFALFATVTTAFALTPIEYTSISDLHKYSFDGVYNLDASIKQDEFCKTKVFTVNHDDLTANLTFDDVKFSFTNDVFKPEGQEVVAENGKKEKIKVKVKVLSLDNNSLKGKYKLLVANRDFAVELVGNDRLNITAEDEVFKKRTCQFVRQVK